MARKPDTPRRSPAASTPAQDAQSAPVRVLIVDDSEAVRNGLSMLLASRPHWEVVGAVDTVAGALERAHAARPHVVLLDFSMPAIDPFALMQQLAACTPRPAVLMLSALANEACTRRAMAAGAAGWVLKDAEPDLLFAALRRAAASAMARWECPAVDAATGHRGDEVAASEFAPRDRDGASSLDARTVRALLRALRADPSGASAREVADSAVVSLRVAVRHLRRLEARRPALVALADSASAECRYVLTAAGEDELRRLERGIAAGDVDTEGAAPSGSVTGTG